MEEPGIDGTVNLGLDILVQPQAIVGLTGRDVPPTEAEAACDRQQADLASRLDSNQAASTKAGAADSPRRLKGGFHWFASMSCEAG